jgi:hypothetical protein
MKRAVRGAFYLELRPFPVPSVSGEEYGAVQSCRLSDVRANGETRYP